MYKLIFIIIISIIFVTSSKAQFTQRTEIEYKLAHADSLYSLKLYNEVINILKPIESSIEKDDKPNIKHYYYLTLASSLLYQKRYTECIQYLAKSSKFNTSDLDDLLCAANISATKLKDLATAKKYARKAVIKHCGNTHFEGKLSSSIIGRLMYLLGLSYMESNDTVIAEECLKIHNSLELDEQKEINQDLHNYIISTKKDILPYSPKQLELLRVQTNSQDQTSSRSVYNDSTKYINAINSCKKISLKNLDYYLNNVFALDSIYELTQNIYSSKQLLDSAIKAINDEQITLSSSLGIQLMVRVGRMKSCFGEYDEALEWFLLAKEKCDNIREHGNIYVTLLQLIANLYISHYNEKLEGRLFIDEVLEVYQENNGSIFDKSDSETHSLLINYANILEKTGNYNIAENVYRYIITHCQDRYSLIFALNNYGCLLSNMGRIKEAIYYYEQLNNNFPSPSNISNLIVAYIQNNDFLKAEFAHGLYFSSIIGSVIKSISTFTNSELEKLLNKVLFEFYSSNNCFADKIKSPQSLVYGFDATIFCKTFNRLYHSAIKKYLNELKDPTIIRLYESLQTNKEKLIKITEETEQKYIFYDRIISIEDSLKHNLPELVGYIFNEGISYHDISSKLEEDEMAIEFFEYTDLMSNSDTTIYYAAYIILPNTEAPIMIKLTPFLQTTNAIRNMLFDEVEANYIYSAPNSWIYCQVWNKLLAYAENKKTIYYSTSGALSFINHGILLDNNNIMLCDKYQFHRVSSTSQIEAIKKYNHTNYYSAILYGDIDYDTSLSIMTQIHNKYTTNYKKQIQHDIILNDNEIRSGWNKLSYTLKEIDNIKNIMDSADIKVDILKAQYANEESFKILNFNAPDIIHLATHGFSYYYNSKSNVAEYISQHLSYSDYNKILAFEGLLLSGCNNIWQGILPLSSTEDGILTAEEISELDLSNTKLVVLSACETGRGSLNLLGNTIGLQDAFKTAGVQSILMSLWKVPDASTALLMTYFYDALINGNTSQESLKIAMKKVRGKYPDPYYWGAFIVLD